MLSRNSSILMDPIEFQFFNLKKAVGMTVRLKKLIKLEREENLIKNKFAIFIDFIFFNFIEYQKSNYVPI